LIKNLYFQNVARYRKLANIQDPVESYKQVEHEAAPYQFKIVSG